jgi:Adenylate and Guanylate cyclase catalytic domain
MFLLSSRAHDIPNDNICRHTSSNCLVTQSILVSSLAIGFRQCGPTKPVSYVSSAAFHLAARMESNGAPNKIHMSQDTARMLQEAGKKWAKKRADLVEGMFFKRHVYYLSRLI